MTGALLATTGFTVGCCCFGTEIGGAFFNARHSSSIALSCSPASLLGDCKSRIAFAKDVSKEAGVVAMLSNDMQLGL